MKGMLLVRDKEKQVSCSFKTFGGGGGEGGFRLLSEGCRHTACNTHTWV